MKAGIIVKIAIFHTILTNKYSKKNSFCQGQYGNLTLKLAELSFY